MKKIIGGIAFIVAAHFSYGQSCSQLLGRAEDAFIAGKLLDVKKNYEEFQRCLQLKGDGGLSKDEKIRARKLLTKVYIFTDDEAPAERELIGLLKEDPEHYLDPQTDPRELHYLMQQFRTAPIFRIGFRAGTNICDPFVIGEFSTANVTNPKFYNGKTASGETETEDFTPTAGYSPGFFGEILIERKLYKGLDGFLGPQFRSSTYNVEYFINESVDGAAANKQSYLRVPLGFRYTLWSGDRLKNFLPYVFAGASFDYLVSGTYVITRNSYSLPSDEDDLIDAGLVNQLNYSYFAGLGIKYRVKTHFVTLDVRYDISQRNYINADNRYVAQNSFTFDSAFAEDNVSLNLWSVALGFTYSVHKPVKLKEYR